MLYAEFACWHGENAYCHGEDACSMMGMYIGMLGLHAENANCHGENTCCMLRLNAGMMRMHTGLVRMLATC
jgi:hypothetical protein